MTESIQSQEQTVEGPVTLPLFPKLPKHVITQENGQRRYVSLNETATNGGNVPPKGCEIFVRKIPRDCFEDELVPFFSKIGPLFEMRLMMDFNGFNRGYCFVQYCRPDHALQACRELNHAEIRKGHHIGVVKSIDNCRLFVGGIPKDKTERDIHDEIKNVAEGVVKVIAYPSANDKSKNRGFAFVEFESHKAAAIARRKLIPGKILLWGVEIAVDWAEPEPDVDSETMSKVKILYVRNLMLSTTEEALREIFDSASDNGVEKVKKLKDYAFIHFQSRSQAEKVKDDMNGTLIEGSQIEISWAKPVDKNVYKAQKALSRQLYSSAQPQRTNSYQGIYDNANSSLHQHNGYQIPASFISPIPGFQFYPQISSLVPSISYNAGRQGFRVDDNRPRSRTAAGVQGMRLPGQNQHRGNRQSNNNSPPRNQTLQFVNLNTIGDPMYYSIGVASPISSAGSTTTSPPSGIQTHSTAVLKNMTVVQELTELCTRYAWGDPVFEMGSVKDEESNSVFFTCRAIVPHYPNHSREFRSQPLFTETEARTAAAEGLLRSLQLELNGFTIQTNNSQFYGASPVMIQRFPAEAFNGNESIVPLPLVYR